MAHPGYIGLLWALAVTTGVMAGVYFAFSAFVMTSLAQIEDFSGIAAMQSINKVIVNSLFLPLFFGTTLLCVITIVLAALRWGEPDAASAIAGSIVYIVGMFLCTLIFNIPLNNALDKIDPASTSDGHVWQHYLIVWTRWNHVRTVSCTAACALFIAAVSRTS